MGRSLEILVKVIAIIDTTYWLLKLSIIIFCLVYGMLNHMLEPRIYFNGHGECHPQPLTDNTKNTIAAESLEKITSLLPGLMFFILVVYQMFTTVTLAMNSSPKKAPGQKWRAAGLCVVTHIALLVIMNYIVIVIILENGDYPIILVVIDAISIIFILIWSLYTMKMWNKRKETTIKNRVPPQAETVELESIPNVNKV